MLSATVPARMSVLGTREMHVLRPHAQTGSLADAALDVAHHGADRPTSADLDQDLRWSRPPG